MRKITILFALVSYTGLLQAQAPMEKVMEKRAREMVRVIGLDDKEQWKAFIKNNYTQALIDKPMRTRTESSDGRATTPVASSTPADAIEAKASMYQRLHDDFGGGTIKSLKVTSEKLDMVVSNNGMNATFSLKFSATAPYLIDGLGIEVGEVNR